MAFFNIEPTPFRKKVLTFIKFVFFLGLGIFIIWLSLKDLTPIEKSEISKSFKIANYNWVILALFMGILSHLLRSLRWIILLEPMGYKPSVKNTFYAVMIGYFANMAFPRMGELTRCGILAKYEKIPFTKSFGTVITERALDLIVLISLFFLTILTQIGKIQNYLQSTIYPKLGGKFSNPFSNPVFVYSLIIIVIALLLFFFIFRKRIRHSKIYQRLKHGILSFWEGLKSLSQIREPGWFIFYSVAIWGMYFLMLYLCFFCFVDTSHLGLGAGLSALVLGSIGILITPGGIGIYPALIQETLMLYGVSNTTGLALGWIVWTAQTAMIICLGTISLLFLSFNKNINGKA